MDHLSITRAAQIVGVNYESAKAMYRKHRLDYAQTRTQGASQAMVVAAREEEKLSSDHQLRGRDRNRREPKPTVRDSII